MAKKPVKNNAAITPFLAAIGNATTEVTRDGKTESMTNYELLAQQMWDWARGWTEQVPVTEEGVVVGYKSVYHPPDKAIAKTIYDRMEGRPSATADVPDEFKAKPVPLAKKLAGQIVTRLNNNFGAVDYARQRPDTGEAAEVKGTETSPDNAVPNKQKVLAVSEDRANSSKRPPGKPEIPSVFNRSGRA